MSRLAPPLRRVFAAFAAVTVLFAPVAQVAHAQAMNHAAAECAHPTTHQHMPGSSQHGAPHQHAGTCCDFCSTGCATTVLLSSGATVLATPVAGARVTVVVPALLIRTAPSPHLLPFSLAPPLSIA